VAQEAQIRSVAEEAAAHLREDDGAHRDHSEHNREPHVQGPWRAFRDAVGFHRDPPLRVYAGRRPYGDPQDSSRWFYRRATEPTVRIKRSRRPGFHSRPRTRAFSGDTRPPRRHSPFWVASLL